MTIADLARKASRLAINHSPTILTSIGVVGAITTAYLASKASFQAARVLESPAFLEDSTAATDKEFRVEQVKEVWQLYIPAGIMLTATCACIIGANKVGARRAAGLAAATTILEKSFDEYKTKVAEKFGEKKHEQVLDEVAQDQVSRNYGDEHMLIDVGESELCYDPYSDRYFRGSVEGIQAAVNSLNNDMNHDGSATLADFYRLLDMNVTLASENVGWNHDRLLRVRITSALAHNSRPAIVMNFDHEPTAAYGRFH